MSKTTANSKKDWWAPVWTGLVMDRTAKHYQAMGRAVWLYLYLILNADRKSGLMIRKIKTIAAHTGINERTIRFWMKKLKDHKYISTQNTGRSQIIQPTLWKTLSGWQNHASQSDTGMSLRVAKLCHSGNAKSSQNPANLRQKFRHTSAPNDITITKDILKNDIDRVTESNFSKNLLPKNKKLLAAKIAILLDDESALPLYLAYTKKYPERLIREVLGIVLAIPKTKIKKSRGALFNYLVQLYAGNKEKNTGH
jgi:hypothetical protein